MATKASHILAALASIACICLFPVFSASAEETASADAAAEQTGWIRTDERITYRFADGRTASGETEIDGVVYLFSYSGTLKTDWQTVGGKRFYFDPATGEAMFGWVDYFGSLYYVSQEEGKLTGAQEIGGESYLFDEDGALQEMILTEPAAAETTAPAETTTSSAPETTAVQTEPAIVTGERITEPQSFAAYQNPAPAEVPAPLLSETQPAAQTAASPSETLPFADEPAEQQLPETFPPLEEPQETVPAPAAVPDPAAEIPVVPEEQPAAPAEELPAEQVFDDVPAPTATKSAFELSVPAYLQKDPAWVNAPLGGETIGKYGCLVTAMAMLHSYTVGPCTPVDMTALLTFTPGGSLQRWDDIAALGYAVESYSTPVTPEILEALYQHLSSGKPVVLGSIGSWQHYVIVTGYTGDGNVLDAADFTIHDPGYPNRVTLDAHLASFGKLYKLIYAV